MDRFLLEFIQNNSPDGGFLQSQYWRKFQESVGRKTYNVFTSDENGKPVAWANIIEHTLPVVGRYFYVPRGPIVGVPKSKSQISNKIQISNSKNQKFFNDLISLAKENDISWIRIESTNAENFLEFLKLNLKNLKIKKSAVDMQPREILILDISRSEDEILAKMKQKTRYNIRLSQKRGVLVKTISDFQLPTSRYCIKEFLHLIRITAERDKITVHPQNYYQKMFETIPPEILKLYIAEYKDKIIAANLIVFFGKTATYLHGASANIHREVMAPYLLQWRAIQDAKEAGCKRYDLGGVKIQNSSSWSGITKFKTGFSPETKPIQFPGCYDIILRPGRYNLYRFLQKIKRIF